MLKGYRTIIFNVAMSAIMVIRLWNPEAEVPDAASVDAAIGHVDAAIAAVWGLGNMLLRAITNTAMGKKE